MPQCLLASGKSTENKKVSSGEIGKQHIPREGLIRVNEDIQS